MDLSNVHFLWASEEINKKLLVSLATDESRILIELSEPSDIDTSPVISQLEMSMDPLEVKSTVS